MKDFFPICHHERVIKVKRLLGVSSKSETLPRSGLQPANISMGSKMVRHYIYLENRAEILEQSYPLGTINHVLQCEAHSLMVIQSFSFINVWSQALHNHYGCFCCYSTKCVCIGSTVLYYFVPICMNCYMLSYACDSSTVHYPCAGL